MGGTRWSEDTYKAKASSYTGKSRDTVFTHTRTRTISSEMSPMNLGIRESRDSLAHPESLAIMVALDVTGSMGTIPEMIVRDKLPSLMTTLVKNKVEHAHVMFLAVGDHINDNYPLQVSQFEAGATELDKWLTSINIESGGGGTCQESYLLTWLVGARHTSIDCFEKRGKKGFLFTIGDEESWSKVDKNYIKDILGYKQPEDVTDVQLLEEAQKMYHVFHIHCNSTGNRNRPNVLNYWKKLLGQRFILLEDYNKVCEVIASTVAVVNGEDIETVTSGFDTSTALAVKSAISPAVSSVADSLVTTNSKGIITL